MVNYTLYDRLLQKLAVIEDPNTPLVMPVDNVYVTTHPESRCYAINPSLAYQKIGNSMINSTYTPEMLQFQPLPPS